MRIFLIGVILSLGIQAKAQCPVAYFSAPAAVCVNQQIPLTSHVLGETSLEWDFCSGELVNTPTVTPVLSNTLLFRTRSLRIVKQHNIWYGFAIDQASSPNRLIRFRFGDNLNNTPSVEDVGNPSGMLSGAFDFRMYQEGENWYALVANTGGNSILRMSFGVNLEATPTVQNLGSLGLLNTPNNILLQSVDGLLYAFVSNGGPSPQIVRLDFGSSILNTPNGSVFTVTGASGLRGMAITRECDRWFGVVTSYGNGKVFWLDFVNGINQPPQSGEITFFTAYNFPASVSLAHDGGEYFAFIQSAVGVQYRLNFGNSILDKTGTGSSLGNLGVSNENFALEMVKNNSDWFVFTIDLTNRRLIRETFQSLCDASIPIYKGLEPPLIYYTGNGEKKISQYAKDESDNISVNTKSITVSSNIAPAITFISQNICAQHNVNFFSQNISEDIATYTWRFGDSNTSFLPHPTHIFNTSGEYTIELEVIGQNGCVNLVRSDIRIFDQPTADFDLPMAVPICTNQNLLFNNATEDVGYTPSWEWSINGTVIETTENLNYTFNATTTQEVKLKTSIPGCESERIKIISSIAEGASPDFSFTNHCEDESISFTNQTSGSVTNYFWDFGTGQTAISENPENTFADANDYTVTLTASNAAGCNNTLSKTVTIYSKPQVTFSTLAPPFSCSATATHFSNTTPNPTDSNIASWAWSFGDTDNPQNNSGLKNPQHTYDNAGDYTVSLTATTNFLCETTLEKTITIAQSPLADFIHASLCEDAGIEFNDATNTNTAWTWQIGSSFYTTENPTHIFANAGNYDVTLSVTGENNCIGSVTRTVHIPQKLAVDFITTKTCRLQDTEFVNITNDVSDPITAVQWNFGTVGNSTDDPALFSFLNSGTVNVTLSTTTQSGCVYVLTKPITISDGPVAAFTATPNRGETPFTVRFTNTSINANTYQWFFNDATSQTSTQTSPTFTYAVEGMYMTELIATDLQGCIHKTQQLIEAIKPLSVNLPYPNPSRGGFTIEWETESEVPTQLTLVDAVGHIVQTHQVVSVSGINQFALDLTNRPAGLYILTLNYLNRIQTFRLIVRQ